MSTTPETETRCWRLPPGFVFGVATAAYQIEGAQSLGGRTPSIWDVFSQIPGRIADGTSGQIAADHLHRWPEDVALLADLGVGAYRLSLSWPRVQPHDSRPVSPDGLGFYDRLLDALLAAVLLESNPKL
jgi:beta-glucosidase